MRRLGKFIATTVIAALLIIGIRKLLFDEFNNQVIIEALITAVLLTSLSGITDRIFFRSAKKVGEKLLKTIPDIDLNVNEKIIVEEGASHFRGMEAVGGKLTLTNKRIVFQSHKLNLQNHKAEISLDDIKSVVQGKDQFKKTFLLELRDSEVHRFLVESPTDWIIAIPQTH